MIVSQKGQLALAAVLELALQPDGAPLPAKTLAARQGLTPRHLEPVLRALIRDGILKSFRGPHLTQSHRRAHSGDGWAPDNRFHQETSSKGRYETTAPDDGEAPGPHWASHKEHQAEVPGVRRRGLALIIAVTALALLGTAGAFDYREIFRASLVATPPPIIRASSEPNKFAPVSNEHQAKNSGNARQDRADITGSIETLVSREEQPKTIEPPKRAPRSSSPRALTRLLAVSRYRLK
jgi:hypothetical protein